MNDILEKACILFKDARKVEQTEENINIVRKIELQDIKAAQKLYSKYGAESQNYADQIYSIIKTLPVNHDIVYAVILLHTSIHTGYNLAHYQDKFSSNIIHTVNLTDKILSYCNKSPSGSVHNFNTLISDHKELAEIAIFSSLVLHLYKVSIFNGADTLFHEIDISKIISSYYIPYLISHIEHPELVDILQDLCFKIQSPSMRNDIVLNVCTLYPNIEDITNTIKTELQSVFKHNNIEAHINYRIKSPQSIYTKTFVKNVKIETLHDIIGFRIIAQNVADCYVAAKLIDAHKVFDTINSLGVDYIHSPKKNGYQSIHKVVSWNNHRIELQIRSTTMHRQTQFESAHSQYKITKYFSYTTITIMMSGQSIVIDIPVFNMQNHAIANNNLYALFAILPVKHACALKLDINIRDHIDIKAYFYSAISPNNQHIVITLLQSAQVIKPNIQYNTVSLHNAVRSENIELVNNLVKNSLSIDVVNRAGKILNNKHTVTTSIQIESDLKPNIQYNDALCNNTAARSGNLEWFEHLVKLGASIDKPDQYGTTPLHHAVIGNHIDLVKYLIECGGNMNAKTKHANMTPLLYAACYTDIMIAKELVVLGADINADTMDGSSVLWHIVERGDIDFAKELVRRGADVNVRAHSGTTLLHAAVDSDNLELVQYIIEELGVNDVHAKDRNGQTPLHYAAYKNNTNIIQYLLGCGADINAYDHSNATPLLYAAKHGNLTVAKYLISLGADINAKNIYDSSVLWHIVRQGDIECARELVLQGAEMHDKDSIYGTLLHAAAANGKMELVRYVVEELGINDVLADGFGNKTPLHYAAYKNNTNIIQYLLEDCGADINAYDYNNETPLLYAVKRGNLSVAKYLISLGADINAKTHAGQTFLHIAVSNNDLTLTKYLIENKSDINIRDVYGYTPRDYARTKDNVSIEEFLIEQECSTNMTQDMSYLLCPNILHKKIYTAQQSEVLHDVISTIDYLCETNDVLEHSTLSGVHTEFDDYLGMETTFGI